MGQKIGIYVFIYFSFRILDKCLLSSSPENEVQHQFVTRGSDKMRFRESRINLRFRESRSCVLDLDFEI